MDLIIFLVFVVLIKWLIIDCDNVVKVCVLFKEYIIRY